MNRPTHWACAVAATATLLVSGCGPGQPGTEQAAETEETMNQDEAATRVREHIDEAVAALPEGAELEERRGTLFGSCDDASDGGPPGRVTVSERFWVRGLPVEDNEANAELMLEHWTGNGYRVLRDERPDRLTISVEHEEDSFRVTLRVSDEGSLSLGASSPCVRPGGTPED
jgi:hypothetical protein